MTLGQRNFDKILKTYVINFLLKTFSPLFLTAIIR